MLIPFSKQLPYKERAISIASKQRIPPRQMNTFLEVATERTTVLTSAKVALLVGSILALINYGDRIFLRYDIALTDWVKLVITYCVPYCVATYGAARYAAHHAVDEQGNPTRT